MEKMRHYQHFVIFIVLMCTYSLCSAKIPWVEVDVTKIEAQKTEPDGDHVYFYVTEYPSEGFAAEVRIPPFPMHWISKEVKNINRVKLWEGAVPKGECVSLVITLMNQMIPLMLSDEEVGSMQVNIRNDNNKIFSAWRQPNFQDNTKVDQPIIDVPRFVMYGDESQYAVTFRVRVLN